MSEQTIHIWSLLDRGASASITPGRVVDVANRTIEHMRDHEGCEVRLLSTTRRLDGIVREVTCEADVELDGEIFTWTHVFTHPKESWAPLPKEDA